MIDRLISVKKDFRSREIQIIDRVFIRKTLKELILSVTRPIVN